MRGVGRRRGSSCANVALLVASCCLALGAAEIALRALRRPAAGLHTVSEGDYQRIPGMFEPGQESINRDIPALPHRIRINSLGLRGADTSLVPRGLRVLFIGDSFTFGDFVDDDETLPAQVQAHVGGCAEVLNGGVGGTTIVDQAKAPPRARPKRPAALGGVGSLRSLPALRQCEA